MRKQVLIILSFFLFPALLLAQDHFQKAKNLFGKQEYAKAAQEFRQAADEYLSEKSLHELEDFEFENYLTALSSEGNCYYMLDDYEGVLQVVKQYDAALEMFVSLESGLRTKLQSYSYKMWGSYYYGQTDSDATLFKKSEKYYEESLENTDEPDDKQVLYEELAQLYYKWGLHDNDYSRYKAAYEELTSIEGKEDAYLMSHKAMCLARMGQTTASDEDAAVFFRNAIENIDYVIKKNSNDYEARRRKGKILMMQSDRLGIDNRKVARKCYEAYINFQRSNVGKRMDTMSETQREQNWLALHDFLYDCYRLGDYDSEMLYNLSLFSKGYLLEYAKNSTSITTRWNQVQKKLSPNDCAIEFVQYVGKQDKKRMGCLVLQSKGKPRFIDLFSTDSLLHLPLTSLYDLGDVITTTNSSTKDYLYNDKRLPQLIWTPQLLSAIGNARKIYFAPDGFLHLLAIEYLLPDTTKTCYRLSSTRILAQKRTVPKLGRALLCGGIAYETSLQPEERDNDVVAYRFLASKNTTINNLPWTEKEVDSIYKVRNNPNDTLIVGRDATDEAFLRLLKQKYDVIHLSTHGYFGGKIGIMNDIKPLSGDDSMSKSGLLFAGAAKTLADKSFDEDLFDGILSAAELSKQDLRNTDLIVLSACETGLGHLTDDGVYGIQRGLKQAGAQAMVLSLWDVNDYSANQLMRFFYEELASQTKKDIHAAFLKARQRLMENKEVIMQFDPETLTIKRGTKRFETPQHINPFIIIDAI